VTVGAWNADEVVPLEPSSIRARSRPRAVLGVWLWQSALALVGSWPATALVRGAYGHHPRGDAPLWSGGALELLGLLSREANGVRAAISAALVAIVIGALAGLLPMGALAISMAHATRAGRAIGAARAIGGSLRTFRPFASLLIVVSVAQGAVVAMALLVGEAAQALGHTTLGEARAQQLGVGVGLAVLLFAGALGVIHDLARAAVVRFEVSGMRALAVGASTARATPIAVAWAWAWRALAALAPVVIGGVVADRIGGRGGAALAGLAALHQAVVLTRVALRASWLAKALRVVRAPHQIADDSNLTAA
jgi:hypothetical protein